MDLSKYTVKKLQALKQEIDKEIAARRKDDAKKAREEMKAVAAKYGLSLNDLVGGKGAAKGRGKGAVAFRHPDDPAKTWSGRGRKPRWIKEWENAGRSLSDLRAA